MGSIPEKRRRRARRIVGYRLVQARAGLLGAATLMALAAPAAFAQTVGGGDSGGGGGGSLSDTIAAPSPQSVPAPFLSTAPGSLLGGNPTLPGTATGVRVGPLGQQIDQLTAGPLIAAGGWTFTPSIGAQEIWFSNSGTPSQSPAAYVMTNIAPAVVITGNTPSVQANISYNPDFMFFSGGLGSDIAQNLNASATATLIPETLFLDLRGFATQLTATGGYTPGTVNTTNPAYMTQITSFIITPFVRHQFGSFGTGEVGYSLGRTAFATPGGGPATATPGLNAFYNSTALSQQEYVAFKNGDDFGQIIASTLILAEQDTASGAAPSGHNNLALQTLGYQLTPRFALLGQIGYEDIVYSGLPPVRIQDAVWSVGFQYTPTPGSQITAGYGHRDGVDAPFLSAAYALTARSTLYATYSETISTGATAIQGGVAGSTVDPVGNSLDPTTNAPLLVANGFYALMPGIFRMQNLSITETTTFDWATLSFSLQQTLMKEISQFANVPGFSQNGTYGILSLTRQVSQDISANAALSYGVLYNGVIPGQGTAIVPNGNSNIYSATLGLTDQLTRTISGSIMYQVSNFSQRSANTNLLQSMVMLSVNKTF